MRASKLGLKAWMRGLMLLRHAELVRDLGERRFRLLQIGEIKRHFPTARIATDQLWVSFDLNRLDLGDGTAIEHGCVISFGDELNGHGNIAIGDRTWIGQYNNLRAGGGDISIGADCLISQFCTLVASNHGTARDAPIQQQPSAPDRRGVVLEDDVWLGAGTVVTPGVTIGRSAVIGANSVVTRNVPDYEIWAGVPAKRIGEREDNSD